MSGLAGIVNFDGRPVERSELEAMVARMRHRGPDGIHIRVAGAVGMAFCALHTTPEAATVTQPLVDEATGAWLAFDGRLDNQVDLRASGVAPTGAADASWVLAAYRRWGTDMVGHLLGDFALSLWDEQRRELFCATDFFGLKPLYYAHNSHSVRWASEIPALLAGGHIASDIDEDVVAEALAGLSLTEGGTPWRGVRRLPPASSLTVRADGVRTGRHWQPDPGLEIRYSTDEEYAEHLRHLVTEAVRCRLRTDSAILVELSGGLDSSSVLGTVMQLRSGGGAGKAPEALSIALRGTASDETPYFQAVTGHWGVVGHVRTPPDDPLAFMQAQAERFLDLPGGPMDAMTEPLKELVPQLGARVVLSGSGGDDVFTGSFNHAADSLGQLRFLELFRRLRDDARTPGVVADWWPSVYHGLAPLLPLGLRRWRARHLEVLPPWMARDWRPAIDLAERAQVRSRPALSFPTYAQQDIYDSLASGGGDPVSERRHALHGYEQRHPLLDRRIIEFGLAIPEQQRWRGQEVKYVLRKAMAPVLPPTVRQRHGNAVYLEPMADGLTPAVATMFDKLECECRGWVDGEIARCHLKTALRARSKGQLPVPNAWALWGVLGVECWARAFSGANMFT